MLNELYQLRKLYLTAILLNIMMFFLAAQLHAEPFSLVRDPISWLGRSVTTDGEFNTLSLLLFSLMLILNALIWKKVLETIAVSRYWKFTFVKILGYMVLVGFLLMALPCDVFITTHSVGSGFVIGGLWALSTISLIYFRHHFEKHAFMIMHLILHLTALFCGINFVLDSVLKGLSQRPLLAAITLISGICIKKQNSS